MRGGRGRGAGWIDYEKKWLWLILGSSIIGLRGEIEEN